MRHLLWLSLVLGTAGAARANQDGKVGYSGRDGVICNKCHNGGAAPTVTLEGPTTLAAGTVGHYVFTITGGAAQRGGLDIAADNPEVFFNVPSTDFQNLDGELTHRHPLPFTGGALRVELDVVAPSSGESFTLFAAGNSADGDGTTSGDRGASTRLEVTLTGATAGTDDLAGPRDGGTTAEPDQGGGVGGGGVDPAQPVGCSMARGSHPGAPLVLVIALLLAAARRRQSQGSAR